MAVANPLTGLLRAGDNVLIGQAVGEPPTLVSQLVAAAREVDDLTAICGYTLSDGWAGVQPARPRILAYAAHGVLRDLGRRGLVEMVPFHLSSVEGLIERGALPVDVILLQVGPRDAEGYYALGAAVDYVSAAFDSARVIAVEVNANMPRTRATRRLHESQVTLAIGSDRPLAGSPARRPTEVELQVAKNVATLIPSGATVQLGASGLAEAVAAELHDRRGLRVRSGLVGDWLVDLYAAGAMSQEPDSCVASMALGTERLYRFVEDDERVLFAPMAEQLAPAALAECGGYFSINSAVEVDLLGQVNAEVLGGAYVGAVGGQADFFRATRLSRGGSAIVAMASTSTTGESRIVSALHGPVTSLKSDVDVIVTEWGVADIRAGSLRERAERIAAVARPDHREALLKEVPTWV